MNHLAERNLAGSAEPERNLAGTPVLAPSLKLAAISVEDNLSAQTLSTNRSNLHI